MPPLPGISFPHRLEGNDQCIAVLDLQTIISMLDAPFGGTKTSGREVWPVIRLGNRRTVKGKRTQIPITSDPSQDVLTNDKNPEQPFLLTVDSVSHIAGRDGTLVKGYIVRGTVRVGDYLVLISKGTLKGRRVQCIGVGNLSQPEHPGQAGPLVGVLVSGLNEEDVSPGDVLGVTPVGKYSST
jgi:translation elongation factor EF-Tu-like GTPase